MSLFLGSNTTMIEFDKWFQVGEANAMIFTDTSGRDDSGLYIKYGDYAILNVNDSPRIRGGDLPTVDYLFGAFTSGASGKLGGYI